MGKLMWAHEAFDNPVHEGCPDGTVSGIQQASGRATVESGEPASGNVP
jgi:hypothetical protein